MNINTSVALRAGLFGALAGIVVALLGRIPFIGCLVGPLGWLVAVGTGVLYVYFITQTNPIITVADGAAGGAVAGAVAGLAASLISGILTLVFGVVQIANLPTGNSGQGAGVAVATVIGTIFGIVIGTIVWAVLGALGGLIFAAVKGQQQPRQP